MNSTAPSVINSTIPSAMGCVLDQSMAPGNLSLCGNATLFNTWRPKARFIAPEGWMNDPMAMFQRSDGSIHAGYQSHPQHISWGNISNGAAYSNDMTYWYDFGAPNTSEYVTLWPSTIYDIRGVFDGSIIPAEYGWEGKPTILYTSTTATGPLGAVANEIEGVETQSLAYTEDGGASWIKLRYGSGGNPVIYNWPMQNLTGFRDPYVFESPTLNKLLGNDSQGASGDLFATISGGVVDEGSKLFLYRLTNNGDPTDWTYLGPLLQTQLQESWSAWSGNYGINFETAFVNRVNAQGNAKDDGSDASALNIIGMGTERGREDHQLHWPLWTAVDYVKGNGSVEAQIKFSGVADWGASYAYVSFPVDDRIVMIGWTYEDDVNFTLGKQMGYQGAFSLFRELFVKETKNVDPNAPGLNDKGSWSVSNATNSTSGGVTITTLGQRVIPETLKAYKDSSQVSTPANATLVGGGYQAFQTQPTGRHYAITGMFEFASNSTIPAGFRVLASDQEYTDILYNPSTEELTVTRDKSSLITTFVNITEVGKLRLWPQVGATSKTLNLTVFVDNSIIEILANDEFALTTRVYPWLNASVGAGLLSGGTNSTSSSSSGPVNVSNLELWDGLINAWPNRPDNTSRGLLWDGPAASLWGLWDGF